MSKQKLIQKSKFSKYRKKSLCLKSEHFEEEKKSYFLSLANGGD